MKKKIAVTILALVCIMALSIGGTLAYFTAEESQTNVITAGNIDIQLIEKTLDEQGKQIPYPEAPITGIMPSTQVDKIVTVKNTGGNDAYVRVSLDTVITASDGSSLDTEYIKLDYNITDWTKGQDGYYYYNKVLAPDEETKPVITKVSFDKDMGNLYAGSTIEVIAGAHAVQAANNGTGVMEAQGWPAAK